MGYKHIKIPDEGSKITLDDGVLNVPDNPIIPYIEGDGIGIDITPAMIDVVDNAVESAYQGAKKISWMEVYCGEKSTQVYDADTWRPYCHVGDFARLIQMVLEAPKEKVSFEVFNAGGDVNNATKQMIVDSILKKIPDGKVKYQEHGSDPRNYRVNFNKVKTVLGFEPKYTIQNGIDKLVDAMNNHIFDHVGENRNFHGNYEINYRINK